MSSIDQDFAEHDFFRSNRFVTDPYAYFDYLRNKSPVLREPHQGVVMVTGYDEALTVYNDPETYSSCMSTSGPIGGCPIPLEGRGGDDISDLIEEYRSQTPFFDQLPTMDPPEHTKHRALLMRLITPLRLKQNEDYMWELANKQIDTFIAQGKCEFMAAFATPFAVLVISDLLGVPEEDRKEFRKHLIRHEQDTGGAVVGGVQESGAAHSPLEWLYDKFAGYIDDRRRNPQDDVLTGLAQAKFPDGTEPTPMDVARIASNLFAAGQETTVRLLSYALLKIGDDPEVQAQLRANRDLIPNFIEECLRIEGPVKGDFRLAKKPTVLGGVELAAGSFLFIANGAANHDTRKFECPAEFRLDRKNANLHLSFGRGRHTCPGAPLARAEAVVALNLMLDRTSDIRISEEAHGPAGARNFTYLPTFILRGVTHLCIEFDAVESA